VKSEVDNRRPGPTKFTHIRSKNFKEDFFRRREHLLENNILVTKILKAKVSPCVWLKMAVELSGTIAR